VDRQKRAIGILQEELGKRRGIAKPLLEKGKSEEGYLFTEVEGVTVIVGRMGGYQLPAVRSYARKKGETPLDAAVYADDEFKKQIADEKYTTGHFSPNVGTDWYCGSSACTCRRESYGRRVRRSIVNTK
jgi:hypothetical protein